MRRWKQQKETSGVDTVTLKYLLEGDPRAYVVQCSDGCGGVYQCGWPTARELEVRELEGTLFKRNCSCTSTFPLAGICPSTQLSHFASVAIQRKMEILEDDDDFDVIRTKSLRETIDFVAAATRELTRRFVLVLRWL